MATGSVKIEIPFDALIEAVAGLTVQEKQRLMDVLDEQLAERELPLMVAASNSN